MKYYVFFTAGGMDKELRVFDSKTKVNEFIQNGITIPQYGMRKDAKIIPSIIKIIYGEVCELDVEKTEHTYHTTHIKGIK